MDYIFLKWAHIISSTILFGTGIGSAFYMFMANRQQDVNNIYFATRHVVIADWVFTAPAMICQLLTGLGMMYVAGYDMTDAWILWGLILYFFAGACWLPVVWIQIAMRDMAKTALQTNRALPAEYWHLNKWWTVLGSLAFPAIVTIFYLMVFKPV